MIFYIFLMVNGMLYGAIMSIFQFFAILQRISEVFMLEEHKSERKIAKTPSSVLIKIENGAYSWGIKPGKNDVVFKPLKEEEDVTLSGINFTIGSGDLLTITVPINSGKSTLLHAIMDETKKTSGSTTVTGSIAYVSQEPFLFPGTIAENITFGLKIDQSRLFASMKAAHLLNLP